MLWLTLLACGPGRDRLIVYVEPEQAAVVEDFFRFVPWEDVEVREDADPLAAAEKGGRATRIAVVADLDCTDCYELEGEGRRFVVHGSAPLGIQYGLTDLLEEMGFRFWHPYAPVAPVEIQDVDPAALGVRHEPEVARRGLHLHTLHPIEGLDAFWIPSEQGLAEAERIVDWTIKNRGNHVQWVGLDDISDPAKQAAWEEHTKAIVDHAHSRGVTVGLGVQLFGTGNLQLAYDLLDEVGTPEQQRADIDAKLDQIGAIDWDLLHLSFGEFFGEDPETFVASATIAYERFQARWPGIAVPTVIHVGNYENLRVEYQGEEILYYFLVKFVDGLEPWVHTTMYYNLFEDAGGAYLHDEFDEHRAFLLDRLETGEPVGYFPETAYWVAFDNCVPQYFPLYVRSRWTDLHEIRLAGEAVGAAPLDDHVLFSSGWEWGYWQNDAASLRMSYELPDDWHDLYTDMFAANGEVGEKLAAGANALGDVQHEYVIGKRLAAYLAGRDSIIDFGDNSQGILSQPDRPDFEEIVAMDPAARAAFQSGVVNELSALAVATRDVLDALPEDPGDGKVGPYVQEMRDGVEMDALRAEFAAAVFGAAVALGDGESPAGFREEAVLKLTQAKQLAARRLDGFHDPDGDRWVRQEWENPTIYDYGYLARADAVCFWERELVQLTNLIDGADEPVPGCAL
jgi:hypothetical protein